MIALFKSKEIRKTESEIRSEIQRRAEINSEARKLAIKMSKEAQAEKIKIDLNKETTLQTLDGILDSVSAYDNIKISTLCELYNAIETGDAKNLIKFLKTKDKIVVKKKKKLKPTWVL